MIAAFFAGGLCVYLYNKLFFVHSIEKVFQFSDGNFSVHNSGKIAGTILEKFLNISIHMHNGGAIYLNFPEAAKINFSNVQIHNSGSVFINGKKYPVH